MTRQYYAEYLKILYKKNKYELLFQEAEKMYSLYSTDLTPLEWICKVYNELVIEGIAVIQNKREKIEHYFGILLNIQSDSSIGLFTKSVTLFEDKHYNESKDILKQGMTLI